ncbi:MAG: hypothetical protein AABX38_02780 [Candidatus Micrarchaeota archaeon]
MKKPELFENSIAELAGLWIAEGDDKTKWEITITNNSLELIKFSYNVLKRLFRPKNFRIYIYLPEKSWVIKERLPKAILKYYMDQRANKPYFILRFANVIKVKEWKQMVQKICSNERYYSDILRGFFAGEGNIKTGTHSDRTLRMAQKEPIPVINKILEHFQIEWKFSNRERSYVIVGRNNWKKLADIRIADMHPIKKQKFWEVYDGYKQWHYKKHYIRDNIETLLITPLTSSELAIKFNRDHSRLTEILCELKKKNKVQMFKVRSKIYWLSINSKIIPISKRKRSILDTINVKPKRTYEIAHELGIDQKGALRRLRELEKLQLVYREDYFWSKLPIQKEVLVYE